MNRLVWNGDKIVRRVEKQTPKITACLAKTIADKARRIVPVKTGKLKATIRVEGGNVIAGGGDVDYAAPVELGTAKRAAQPFLRPAAEQVSKSDLEKCVN